MHKYLIVHYSGYEASGDFDGDAEYVAEILAATARQAVDSYCVDRGVHRNSIETHEGRVWHEWYEAEEVNA